MNWLQRNGDELCHLDMTLSGGITGIYAILLRGGNFGAAQTSNLIGLVLDVLNWDWLDFMMRAMALLTYGASLIAAYLIAIQFPQRKKYLSLLVEIPCVLLAGLFPAEADPLLALCPVFALSAFQWQNFTDPKCYNSSTLFSTNNLKQFLLSWTNYWIMGDPEHRRKAFFFARTLLVFHFGILVGFFAMRLWNEKAIWIALAPLGLALIYEGRAIFIKALRLR